MVEQVKVLTTKSDHPNFILKAHTEKENLTKFP